MIILNRAAHLIFIFCVTLTAASITEAAIYFSRSPGRIEFKDASGRVSQMKLTRLSFEFAPSHANYFSDVSVSCFLGPVRYDSWMDQTIDRPYVEVDGRTYPIIYAPGFAIDGFPIVSFLFYEFNYDDEQGCLSASDVSKKVEPTRMRVTFAERWDVWSARFQYSVEWDLKSGEALLYGLNPAPGTYNVIEVAKGNVLNWHSY